MLQTTHVDALVSESLPEIEVKTPVIGRDEIVQLIKSEEVGAALQVLLNHFADMVADRVLTRLGTVESSPKTIVAVEPPAVLETPIVKKSVIIPPSSPETPSPEKAPAPQDGKRHLSEAARKRISESQKAKWATRSRHLTPEAKAKISDSQKKRWAAKNGTATPANTPRESDTSTEADSQNQHSSPIVEVTPPSAVLAVKDGYKGDPFYISEDGHFIGMDGFVVPKDFEEFIDRHPKYIENWVRRRLSGQGIEEDIEDWCQDLMIHMKYLPPTSKHRKNGKTDVFQTFDPFSQYGATERRWRNYINYCLANKYNTIHGKRAKNPVCRAGNLSLASETNPEVHGEVTDEYVYSKSEYLMAATTRETKKQENWHFVNAFIKFVQQEDPDVFPVLMAVYEAGSSADTIKEYCRSCQRLATTVELENNEHEGHEVGMTAKEYNRARNRLKQLVGAFQKQRTRKLTVKSS